MSLPTHDEPWLRDQLDLLLADEPAMRSSVQDDVRRGERARARRRRRTGALLAIGAVAVAVLLPAAALLQAPSATPDGVGPSASRDAVVEELRSLGYAARPDGPGLAAPDGGTARAYTVHLVGSDVVTYRMLVAVVPGAVASFGELPTACARGGCSPVQVRQYDCASVCPTMAWASATRSLGDAGSSTPAVPTGSLVVALGYPTGIVEGVFTPGSCATCSLASDAPLLTVDQARAVLLAAGAPPSAPGSTAPAASG